MYKNQKELEEYTNALFGDKTILLERNSPILEPLEKDLESYLPLIADEFESEDMTNLHFIIGAFYSASCEYDMASDTIKRIFNDSLEKELITIEEHSDILRGYSVHRDLFCGEVDLEDDEDRVAFYVTQALSRRYFSDVIQGLALTQLKV